MTTTTNDDSGLSPAALSQIVTGPIQINGDLTVTGRLEAAVICNVHDAATLLAAVALHNSTGTVNKIICAPGTYSLAAVGAGTAALTVTRHHLNILGAGDQASVIDFTPTAHDQVAIRFDQGTSQLVQCSFGGFGFKSSDTTFRKIALELVDCQQFELSHCAVSGSEWTDASFLSEFVRRRGRQTLYFFLSSISADIPVHITANPHAGVTNLCADHDRYGPALELIAAAGNPAIKNDVDTVFSSTTFDGVAFARGGFKFSGTSATASFSLVFRACRFEQFQAGEWPIDINGTTLLQSLTIDDCRLANPGVATNGIRLRTVREVKLSNVFMDGTGSMLDVDATVFNLKGDNVRVPSTATVSIAGQRLVRAGSPSEEASPLLSPFFEYQSTASTNPIMTTELGEGYYRLQGTLANGANVNLIGTFATTEKVVEFVVKARNNVTNAIEGGIVIGVPSGAGNIVALGNTANFAVGNVIGKLTLLWQNAAQIILLNQLGGGATVDYDVQVKVYK